MAEAATELDPLVRLEERIQRAVALVKATRAEKDAAETALKQAERQVIELEQQLVAASQKAGDAASAQAAADKAATENAALQAALEESRTAQAALADELAGLRDERRLVRGRLEKLLGHIDELSA